MRRHPCIFFILFLVACFATACAEDSASVGDTNNGSSNNAGTNNAGTNNAGSNNAGSNNGAPQPRGAFAVPTSGGGEASSDAHQVRISVGSPQPFGRAASENYRVHVGPVVAP